MGLPIHGVADILSDSDEFWNCVSNLIMQDKILPTVPVVSGYMRLAEHFTVILSLSEGSCTTQPENYSQDPSLRLRMTNGGSG